MSYHSGQSFDPAGSIRLPADFPWFWESLDKWSNSILDDAPSSQLADLIQAHDPAAFVNNLPSLFPDATLPPVLNVWRRTNSPEVDESVLKLWQAGLFLARAIERTALELSIVLPWQGMAWAFLLQGPLWVMAADSPESFHHWLQAQTPAERHSIEIKSLGTKASIWSQIVLQRSGHEELAKFLWTTRDLATLPGGQGQGTMDKSINEVLVNALKLYHQSRYHLYRPNRSMSSLKDPKVSLIELQVDQIAKLESIFAPTDDRLLKLVTNSIRQHQTISAQSSWMTSATRILLDMQQSADQLVPQAANPQRSISQEADVQVARTASLASLNHAESRWQSLKSFWWKMMDRMDEWADSVSHEHHVSESQAQAMRFESLAEFAAGAGHELNNPLAVIQGRAQQLLAKSQDASSRQALKAIVDQTTRAHRMLRDLIFIARPGRPNTGMFRPADMVRGVVKELREEADRRQVTLEMNPNRLGRLETDQLDPDGFRQILLGLARNAIEASPPDSCVQVQLIQEVGSINIQVADQGLGFSSTDAAHLFDPFYCGRKAGRGLGLGLPRMARVVSQMNGRIRYRSNPGGKGSTFEVILPLPESSRPNSLSHSA